MRLFVSEYLTSGAWPQETLDSSLAIEGKSMLLALLSDLESLPGCEAFTTWDFRLGPFPGKSLSRVTALVISSPEEETRQFQEHAGMCDQTFVIAPEFDGILAERVERVKSVGGTLVGCSRPVLELCADKLQLAEHLQCCGVKVVETTLLDHASANLPFEFPVVVKPQYGAGSQQTFLVSDEQELKGINGIFSREKLFGPPIVQPFVPGETVSVAALVSECGQRVKVLPITEQRLSQDGRFEYLGGRVPVHGDLFPPVAQLVQQICGSLDGLNGYIGMDLVLPMQHPDKPVLLEINPRLTTSYLGYRELFNGNLAERILFPDRFLEQLEWNVLDVCFFPDGRVKTLTSKL